MSRFTQPVKVTLLTEGPWKGEEEREHPAFVQVTLHRTSGKFKLYGSALPEHSECISLKVSRSSVRHGLGRDWYHGELGSYIEVKLSPAQFADLITGMNSGAGVPGTLQYLNGKEIPQIPWDHETESTKVVDGFKRSIVEQVKEMNALVGEVKALLEKKTLLKSERKEISDKIHRLNYLYSSNAPYMVEQFQEATEKVVTSAKAEVEAFMHRTIKDAGVKALSEVPVQAPVPQLAGKKDK